MVNIGVRDALENIDFSRSRNAALIERKMLQYTTLSIKLRHCTSSGTKTQVSNLSDVLALSQNIARIRSNTQPRTS